MDIDTAIAESSMRLLALARRLPQTFGYAVNIGASDGITQDLMIAFYRAGWGGLAVECDLAKFGRLCDNLPDAVRKVNSVVTPANVVKLFTDSGVPTRFDVMDIDIDGYDLDVAIVILDHYRPSLVSLELNEDIPPGIEFAVHYSDGHHWSSGPFFGASIDMVVNTLKWYGYDLLCVDWHNVFFVDERYRDVFSDRAANSHDAWLDGYFLRGDKQEIYFWKDWANQHYGLPLDEVMGRLQRQFAACSNYTLRYTNRESDH